MRENLSMKKNGAGRISSGSAEEETLKKMPSSGTKERWTKEGLACACVNSNAKPTIARKKLRKIAI